MWAPLYYSDLTKVIFGRFIHWTLLTLRAAFGGKKVLNVLITIIPSEQFGEGFGTPELNSGSLQGIV